MPLNKYAGRPVEEICRGCDRRETKTPELADHLKGPAVTAIELSRLHQSGASFSYPHALPAVEWAILTGLTQGKNDAEAKRQERNAPKNKR